MDDCLRYDVRLLERNLAKGVLSDESLGAHLQQLPDAAAKSVAFSVQQPEGASGERSESDD